VRASLALVEQGIYPKITGNKFVGDDGVQKKHPHRVPDAFKCIAEVEKRRYNTPPLQENCFKKEALNKTTRAVY
jgi:hypothetical protein